jgi:BirA family transcriptional regulator, biotin operon repressor / biotin---[acetyl-CoA-carboxylase] ligase
LRSREEALRLAAAARPAAANVVVFDSIDSTHACALRLVEQAESEEIILPTTMVIAGRQNHGCGRAGRVWESPPGGLYLSWITAGLEPSIIATLPMIAAAAVHTATSALGIDSVEIKWPNDLLVAGRKLAGLLVHSRHGATNWVTVGIGINIDRAPTIRDPGATQAVSVADLIPKGDFLTWSEIVIRIIAEELQAGVTNPIEAISRWREHLHHRPGDEMVVRGADGSETRGAFAGLTEDGHLRLVVDDAERVISCGDVIE